MEDRLSTLLKSPRDSRATVIVASRFVVQTSQRRQGEEVLKLLRETLSSARRIKQAVESDRVTAPRDKRIATNSKRLTTHNIGVLRRLRDHDFSGALSKDTVLGGSLRVADHALGTD